VTGNSKSNTNNIIRIAVTGPESTGKTTLCKWLAHEFGTVWIEEYSRKFLNKLNKPYTPEDIISIYKQQFINETALLPTAKKIIFVDTEFINTKIWYESLENKPHDWIEQAIHDHPYDLYLLTSPDIPWVNDPLRENHGKGKYFFNVFEKHLTNYNLPYKIVIGKGEERNTCAMNHVAGYLKKN
jgi:NadR type nicotinamide-nucleotide adenylyltransferase